MGDVAVRLETRLPQPVTSAAASTEPPRWVLDRICAGERGWTCGPGGLDLRELAGGALRLISARVPGALELDADGLERRTCEAYLEIAERLAAGPASQAIRVWNFIPGILAPLGPLEHRYMAFNAGRYLAYERWFSGRPSFERRVPTASGVGHDGEDLFVHCLASAVAGVPVENPRQVPSYCYSPKYGPLPPCFARATLARLEPGGPPSLLVGGTAAVRGEETVFADDLEAQAGETFANLASLIGSAVAGRGAVVAEAPGSSCCGASAPCGCTTSASRTARG